MTTTKNTGISEKLDEAILLTEQAAGLYQLAERMEGPSSQITSKHLLVAAQLTGMYLARTTLRCR